jgi:beta-1,4-mannooligosaccharide/beta-1,4-mannosyl-N-acetylglucosamine phosphorylase
MNSFGEVFTRHPGNPILKPSDWPYPVNAVFNPGAVFIDDRFLLLVRVEDRRGFSHLVPAWSKDGTTGWEIDVKHAMYPDISADEEETGLEDPRIVWFPDRGEYVITYTSFTPSGPTVFLALTKDFKEYKRLGPLLPPENKDAGLFPRLFNDRYVLVHRPIVRGTAHIWLCCSPDLKCWGHHHLLMPDRPGMWDGNRVGLGPPPMETDEGWLLIYHGVRITTAGALYRVGAALLDKEDPTKVIYRTREWIFGPNADYENMGDVPGVVFPTGMVFRKDTGMLYLYYGAADTSVCLATAKLKDVCDFIKNDC